MAITLTPTAPPIGLALGPGGAVVSNYGPGTVSYSDMTDPFVAEGTITSGSTATLYGTQFFRATSGATINAVPVPAGTIDDRLLVVEALSAAGSEIGYAENLNLVSTSSGTGVDIAGCSVTIPPGTRPVSIHYGGMAYNGTALGITFLQVVGNVDGGSFSVLSVHQGKSTAANELVSIAPSLRMAASTSTRIVKLQIAASGGTGNLQGQVTGQPTYIHALWA